MKAFTKLSMTLCSFAIIAILTMCFTTEANASHFRYGHLTYVKNPLNPNEVTFTLIDAFRRNGYGAPVVGSLITETIGATSLDFGDASATGTLQYRVIAIDIPNNFLIGRAVQPGDTSKQTITHTYAGAGPFQAEIFSSARNSIEINNPGQSYRVSTIVDVSTGNNSPVSSLPVIVGLVQGPASTFSVPAFDSDPSTTLKWRFASLAEMGGVSQNPPSAGGFPAVINSANGLVTWNTTAAVLGGLYSCQVIIEDRNSADTSIIRTRVAVDFLINILPQCTNPNLPTFDAPTPTCGSVTQPLVGNLITFTVKASDIEPNSVSLNSSGLPAGATMNPALPTSGNPVMSTFSWTPTIGQLGANIVSFTATDSCGGQTICSFTYDVVFPVELSSFTSLISGNNVTLNWSTSTETNNSRFEIERSLVNSSEWSVVGTVNGNGTVSTPMTYSFSDRGLAMGNYSYRLKQVDFNGNFEYHNLISEVVIGVPSRFNLAQNYPNPFNPVTKINFEIPVDGKVTLSVYDMSGKLVSMLVNENRTAGYYNEVFNAANVASGVYYYKIQVSGTSNSFENTLKMVVLK
ncbi:MAG: T9SS type A sorting domain-containing protein [bacterium]|nr:T9SS type A sorting domain-containing protein [bacterium]